jgi:hypothetical protein
VKGAVAIALVAVAIVLAGCGRADYGTDVSFDDVTDTIALANLTVCDTQTTQTLPPDAVAEKAYTVDTDCSDDDGRALVVATAYDSEGDRDAAAQRFEVQSRPSASGAIWTFGPFTVRVSGDRDGDTVDALTDALDQREAR